MRKPLMFVCTMALCSVAAFGQHPKSVTTPRHQSHVVTPTPEAPLALKKIFSNLGPKTSAYSGAAWVERGPNASGGQQFIAMPFSSKVNATVTQVQAAIEYNGAGANQVNLSLYSDNSGTPGTLLAGPVTVTNLPSYFTCCTLAVANFASSTPITAGTQYWVVADTPAAGQGSDFQGVWNFVPPAKSLVGVDQTSSWFSFQAAIQEPAGAVYGTIP